MRGTFRVFVVIPGAGESRRMGRAKLALPLGDKTVIEHTLSPFEHPRIEATAVVVRGDDNRLIELLSATPAHIVRAEHDPADMRESVQLGLRYIGGTFRPAGDDVWMLCPGDCVLASGRVVDELLSCWETEEPDILIPVYDGGRGHPALFRWALVEAVERLPHGVGLNALRKLPGVRVVEHAVTSKSVLADMDTPAEYTAQLERWEQKGDDDELGSGTNVSDCD